MITIIRANRCPRLTIIDEKTFGEICVECRDFTEEEELLVKIIKELLKNED